jgi:hypothetical protein
VVPGREGNGVKTHYVDVISRIVSESTLALFSSCGVPVVQSGPRSRSVKPEAKRQLPSVAGLVGFTGEHVRGTLIVATTFELIDMSRPRELRTEALSRQRASDWLTVRDWSAELANQLLGRIKRRLFVFNVLLAASTPTALSGPTVSMATPKSKTPFSFAFVHGEHEVSVQLDALMAPDFDLTHARKDLQESALEGHVILF